MALLRSLEFRKLAASSLERAYDSQFPETSQPDDRLLFEPLQHGYLESILNLLEGRSNRKQR